MAKQDTVDTRHKRRTSPADDGPFALTTTQAGPYIGRSSSWMRTARLIDAKRIEQGLEPVGPPWRTNAAGGVIYLRRDLEAWVMRSSVAHGHSRFRGVSRGEVEA